MQNSESWKPTKFVLHNGALRASRDSSYLSAGSRFIAGLQAVAYERMIRSHAHGDLLDVGAGAVPLYGLYREFVRSVTCVDWDRTAHNAHHIDLFTDLSRAIPFADASFDTILCTDVFEHLVRPDVVMREFRRLVRPEGRILLSTPFMYWLHEEPHDHHRYTEHRLRGLCEESGLEVISLDVIGGGCDVVIDVLAKHLQQAPLALAAWMRCAKLLSFLARRFDREGKARRRMPLGYTLVAGARTTYAAERTTRS